jgi:MYXO-CTERM domain-containing protein
MKAGRNLFLLRLRPPVFYDRVDKTIFSHRTQNGVPASLTAMAQWLHFPVVVWRDETFNAELKRHLKEDIMKKTAILALLLALFLGVPAFVQAQDDAATTAAPTYGTETEDDDMDFGWLGLLGLAGLMGLRRREPVHTRDTRTAPVTR